MNIGLLAIRAAPQACRALRNAGLFPMTKQDLLDALRGEPNAEEGIFWFAFAWHGGVGSDLYNILCDSPVSPDLDRNWCDNPEVVRCVERLTEVFGPLVEPTLQPVRIEDVQEGQVLIAGSFFPCIRRTWPCRVYKHHGALGVACSGGVHGVRLLPGSETTFHPLKVNHAGIVEGFRR